jgi:mitochondrial division protein 1
VCLTGGEDGNVRLWDLRRVDDEWRGEDETTSLSNVAEEDEGAGR